ncbi:MAG: TorD/DmsD family molecular chaperone [Planctomycetota bacterium]
MSKATAYRLLAGCLCEPEREVLRAEGVTEQLGQALEDACPTAAPAAAAMSDAIAKESDLDLRVEYARLFVGPHELLAPPYGSVYLEDGTVMGESTVAAEEAYHAEGLTMKADELPDHMAIELEFCSYLADRNVEKPFLREHPARWVAPFCARVRERTTSGYYRALADCLEEFVTREAG